MGNAGVQLDGIRRASQSTIEIDFYYKGVRCRERLKLEPTPQNLKLASKLKARIEHEISTGEFDYKAHFPHSKRLGALNAPQCGDETLEHYLEHWLEQEKSILRFSTHRNYSKIVQSHLIPSFGALTLNALTPKHVREWIAAHPDMSAIRTKDVLGVLRTALQRAVEIERIASNPEIGRA